MKPKIKTQTKNGVKVKVACSEKGSVVETDCQCFGHPKRVHSNINCPNLIRK